MTARAKLSFYDVVRVRPAGRAAATVTESIGIIVGISEDEGETSVHYAVLDPHSETTTMYDESCLTPTGRRMSRQDLYDGTALRVVVDLDTGQGSPVDPDE